MAPSSQPTFPMPNDDPDDGGRHVELAHGVDEEDRAADRAEPVRERYRQRDRPPVAVAEQVAKALHQLLAHASLLGTLGRRLAAADREDKASRDEEADRVDEDRERRGDRGDEHARDPRPGERGRGAAHLELRVAVHELLAGDERRQVRLVRDVEEHRQRADDEADDVELPDRECVEGVEERNRGERQSAADVRDRRGSAAARRRSTQTPAGSAKSRNGRNSATPTTATSNALASRTRIAASGIASCEICVPTRLIVWADQSFRKSGCRQRPPRGQRLRMRLVPAWCGISGERRARGENSTGRIVNDAPIVPIQSVSRRPIVDPSDAARAACPAGSSPTS